MSYLYLFAFHFAPDPGKIRLWKGNSERLFSYPFKITCYIVIRREENILFFLSFLLSLNNILNDMIRIISRHCFITRAQIHICGTRLFLVLSASRCFVFFFNRIRSYTSTWGSPSSIRRSSHRDLLGFSAAIRRRFEKKQTVKGGSTFAMYRLGIMAVGAFRALFQTTRRLLLCVTPR